MDHATGNYSADVNLAPGFALTNTWDPSRRDAWYWAGSKIAPCHTCGDKEIRNSPEKGPVAEPYFSATGSARVTPTASSIFRPDFQPRACSRSRVENVKFAADGLVRRPKRASRPA